MQRTLDESMLENTRSRIEAAEALHSSTHSDHIQWQPPGLLPSLPRVRQPVHVLYGGAHLFHRNVARRMGELALAALAEHAPDATTLNDILSPSWAADAVQPRSTHAPHSHSLHQTPPVINDEIYGRICHRLNTCPVEDYRIDFEDAFGLRPEDEEDHYASHVALELAAGWKSGILPPLIGIRVKALTGPSTLRSVRTLDIVLSTLLAETHAHRPDRFIVTLPKVTSGDQVAALVEVLGTIESRHSLPARTVGIELIVESPQPLVTPIQRYTLREFVSQADGRCRSVHLGVFGYTASLGIAAHYQHANHPAAEFAKQLIQACLSGTGIPLVDGPTNVLPCGSPEAVRRAWRCSYQHIRRALASGIYQGWDLHPAQLPVRYAACYANFIHGCETAVQRVRNLLQAARATRVGATFDDAATEAGLKNFFLRGLACGALNADELESQGVPVYRWLGPAGLQSSDH